MVVPATAAGRTAHNPVVAVLAYLMALVDTVIDGYLRACREVNDRLDVLLAEPEAHGTRLEQALSAKTIGKGLVTIGLVVVVLNEVFTINSINNSTGPFAGVIDTVENIGSSALTLVAIAFLVLAGAVAMRFMDRF